MATLDRTRVVAPAAGWMLVAGLVGGAAWGVVILLSSSVNETDARVILTSLGFAAASTTGASGVAATLRPSWGLRALGVATIGCSIVAFGLLVALIWEFDFIYDVPESLWRACGCASVLAIAGGHACLMLRGRTPTDSALVEIVTLSSLAFGSIDAGGALLPLSEIVEEVDESWARILGSVLVLLIATTVLAPLLRRLQRDRSPKWPTERRPIVTVRRRWIAAWSGGALIGVANGVLREATFAKVLSERAAHAASGATAVVAFAGYFSALQRRWPIPTTAEALRIGGSWLGMTVAFEFGFGRTVAKQSWQELLDDYNLAEGRTWPLVLAWIALGPALVRELQAG